MLQGKLPQNARSRPPALSPRTLRVLALAALPALLLHGIVLGGLPATGIDSGDVAAAPPTPIRLRTITAQAGPAVGEATVVAAAELERSGFAAPSHEAAALPQAVEPLAAERGAAVEVASDPLAPIEIALAPAESTGPGEPADPSLEAEQSPLMLLAAATSDQPAAAQRSGGRDAVDGESIPVYPTSFAPSQTLRYQLQRGMLSGTGELSWRREPPERADAGYELQLQAKLAGLTILTQISKGNVDKAGLAPLRFTDQRLRGSLRAVNFQRQRGLITFSGPSVEYPLVRGVQDRLSWMIQVPAILAANPRLAAPGQRITLYVVGARGDATIWDFKFDERERIPTDAGEVMAVKFSRQPRKQYDTLAEVWLDPARQYLPLRARIGNPEEGAMLELRRID